MVSTRKKTQSSRRFYSQLDDFIKSFFIGDSANNGQQNVIVNDATVDRKFTAIKSRSNSTTIENTVIVQTLERCSKERIASELGNIVDAVEEGIQNEIFIAIITIITPKIELKVRSIYASSRQVAASVTTESERGERIVIVAYFESASEMNKKFHELSVNDEIRRNVPDEVIDLLVSGTHFDWQSRSHHMLFNPKLSLSL